MLRCARDGRSVRNTLENLENRRYMSGSLPDPGTDPAPATIAGAVYLDANRNGKFDDGESGIEGVKIRLEGVNDLGQSVAQFAFTNHNGYFQFADLRPGTYAIYETQPDGYADGPETAAPLGGAVGDDVITDIDLPAGTWAGMYEFSEQALPDKPVVPPVVPPIVPPVIPPAGEVTVRGGMTGTIQFWHSRTGQRLIKALNGGGSKTQLGTWLAKNFPNLYGSFKCNLLGRPNRDVAAHFQRLYAAKDNRLDAEVMALALSCYVTRSSLAGTLARDWGFRVTSIGTSGATWRIEQQMAFYHGEGTKMSVRAILRGIDAETVNGRAFGASAIRRAMCWRLVHGINEAGKVA